MTTAVLWSAAVVAQQPSSKKTPGKSDPDYSRRAVLEVFLDDLVPSGMAAAPFDAGFRFDTSTTRFHWVPVMAPIFTSVAHADVTTPMVDPFYLTGTVFPYTSSSANDRFGEWRTRRFLRKNAEAARRN